MRKPQIVVVEDEGLVALELKQALTQMGYEVPAVLASGKEALDHVIAERPDLILMDIRLEGAIDGIETAKRIKEFFHIPVIYLTADLNDTTLQRAKSTESYGYILKPFEERALYASIEIALSKSERDCADREEQEWNEIFLKNMNDGIIATDAKGLVRRINQNALSLLGKECKDCLGKKLGELVRLVDRVTGIPEILSITKTVIDDGTIEKKDCLLALNDTTRTAVEFRLAPMKNRNNNTIGAILFFKKTD